MRMLSRSDRNTVKAVAYRTGTDLYDERSGKWFYYSSKDVVHVELLLPENAPQWAKDLQHKIAQDRTVGVQEFSNLAERAEKRKDSQVYREFEFALPKELTEQQNIKLANEFLQDQACQLGMVALLSFHFDVDEETGEGRPHCHAIFLTRTLEQEELCPKKETSWNQKDLVLTWREQLADYINFHLKMHGHDVRVDHRSYGAQGIDILPQPKLGRGAKVRDSKERSNEVKRGRDQFEIQRQRNVAKIIENPTLVFDIVTRQYATFMWGDVEKVLARYVKEEEIYRSLHNKLKNSAELVLLREGKTREEKAANIENIDKTKNLEKSTKDSELGEKTSKSTARAENIEGADATHTTENNEQAGKVGTEPKSETTTQHTANFSDSLDVDTSIYTTHSMLKSELSLVRLAEKMGAHQSHKTPRDKVEQALKLTNEEFQAQGKSQGLSSDQVAALRHVTQGDQLLCVIGYAGAGKSTMFKTAKIAWEGSGYKVYGLAPTGRAAQNLEEIGIKSQTLHKFLKDYQEGRSRYKARSVLILDEAGMVDVRRFNELLSAADHLGVKLVISGDGAQAQPIEAGPAFRLVTDRLGVQKIDTVIRQQVDWQREATRLFGTYDTKEALSLYLDQDHVKFVEEKIEDLGTLIVKGQHRDVVNLYNLSRRLSGNMWHSITEDLKQYDVGSPVFLKAAVGHVDFLLFKYWQGVREGVARKMIENIETYRPLMKQQGVDPVAFVTHFVDLGLNDQKRTVEIQRLIKHWGLETPDPGQALHISDPREETRKKLIQAWSDSVKEYSDKSYLILTYTNKDTTLLNEEARSLMRRSGGLAIDEHIHTIKRESQDDFGRTVTRTERKAFAVGERLVFTRNDKSLNVKNGTLGTIIEMDRDKLKVKIDQIKASDPETLVSFSSNLNPYFDQGWAITITKSQGSTADRVFKLATHEEDRNLAYVGMTRHREFLRVFGSKLDFWREEIFVKRLSQTREKLSSLDYLSQEEAQGRPQPSARLTNALTILGNKLESWGYTSRKGWESLSARFTGREITSNDWMPHVSQTIDETIRAREMGIAEAKGSKEGTAQENPFMNSPSSATAGASSTYDSGGNTPGSSSSIVITENISDFMGQQEKIDAARDNTISEEKSKCLGPLQPEIQQDVINPDTQTASSEDPKSDSAAILDKAVGNQIDFKEVSNDQISQIMAFYSPVNSNVLPQEEEQNTQDLSPTVAKEQEVKTDSTTQHKQEVLSQETSSSPQIESKDTLAHQNSNMDEQAQPHVEHQSSQTIDFVATSKPVMGIGADVTLLLPQEEIHQDIPSTSSFTPQKYRERSFEEKKYYSIDEVTDNLSAISVENLCCRLLGDPGRNSNRTQLRYGRNGSLAVSLSSSSLGLWKDHERDEGGNIFQLVMREQRLKFGEALAWVAENLHVAPERRVSSSYSSSSEDQSPDLWRVQKVEKLLMASRSIQNSNAETYLRQHRHITCALPNDLRAIPSLWNAQAKQSYPALAALARNKDGTVTAVQVIYLNEETADKADVTLKKQSFGTVKGSYVKIQQGTGPVYLAEGVETALSVKEAGLQGSIYACLGISNFKNIGSLIEDKTRPIVICADQDGDHSPAYKTVEKVKQSLEGEGYRVSVVRPSSEHVKEDFNDILKQQGIEGIKEYFKDYPKATISDQQPVRQTSDKTTDVVPPSQVKTPQEIEDIQPFVGTEKQKKEYLELCRLIKNTGIVPEAEQASYLKLAKQDIDEGLRHYKNKHTELIETQKSERQAALTQMIEDSCDIPDSYKRVYLEDAKKDPEVMYLKMQDIAEKAREVSFNETDNLNSGITVSKQKPGLEVSSSTSDKLLIETLSVATQEVKQKAFSFEEMSKDISRFIDLTSTVKQVEILNNPQASQEIFGELKSIAKDWYQRPEFLEGIKATENSSAIRLTQDYIKEFEQASQTTTAQLPQDIKGQAFSKLEEDTQRFVKLTDTVKQIDVLNSPRAKDIFAELKGISNDWQGRPAFIEKIKTLENNSAIRLAQDHMREQERGQKQTQNMVFEV